MITGTDNHSPLLGFSRWRKIHQARARRHFIVGRYGERLTTFTFCLLLLSGDIHLNPGPTKHPCSVCRRPVKVNQCAIECDRCMLWTHCNCCGVDNKAYETLLLTDSDFTWICPVCIDKTLPFYDCSVLSSSLHSNIDSMRQSITSPQRSHILGTSCIKRGLRIAHLNARSLVSCIDDIRLLIHEEQLDILTLSETWLDGTINDLEVCPTGMNIIRKDRNRRGGGTAILISDRLRFEFRQDLNSDEIEAVWLEIFPRSKRSMLICSAYRSPACNAFFDHLMFVYEKGLHNRKQQHITILGDLNCDINQPSLPQTKLLNAFCKQLFGELGDMSNKNY